MNKNKDTSSDSREFKVYVRRESGQCPASIHRKSCWEKLCLTFSPSPFSFSCAVSINNCIAPLASEWLSNQMAICSSAGTAPPHCDSNWTERREQETDSVMTLEKWDLTPSQQQCWQPESSTSILLLPPFVWMLFSPSEPNLFSIASLLAGVMSPLFSGCCLCFIWPSIHPSISNTSSSTSRLTGLFSFLSIIFAHKTLGGGWAGWVFRAGYTAMGALTRTNAIHTPHLLTRPYEKGQPWHLLWKTQQRTIIHRTARTQKSVRVFGYIMVAVSCLFTSTVLTHTLYLKKKRIHGSRNDDEEKGSVRIYFIKNCSCPKVEHMHMLISVCPCVFSWQKCT